MRFQQALGYDYFYRQAQQLEEAAVQTVVLAAITPRASFLQEYGYLDFFVGLQQQYVEKGWEESIMRKREAITPETVMETGRQLRKSLLAVLTPEERLAGLTPEELRHVLEKNEQARREAVALASPAERLSGLTPEEMLALMKQIEAQLQKQPSEPQKGKRKPKAQQPA